MIWDMEDGFTGNHLAQLFIVTQRIHRFLRLTVTLAKIEQVLENTYSVRPLLSGGDGTTSITVKMMASTPTAYDVSIANA